MRLERIPVNEAAPDHASHIVFAWTPDLASVPEEAWQKAVKGVWGATEHLWNAFHNGSVAPQTPIINSINPSELREDI